MPQDTYVSLEAFRIGIVDDNAYFRRIVRTMLNGLGVRHLHEATTVDEGWQMIATHRPDVLLLDWNLGVGNGVDLLDRIRTSRIESLATQAVVFLSAHSDRRHVLLAAKLGANDFVVKPVSPRLLYDRIRRLAQVRLVYERRNGRLRPVAQTADSIPISHPPQPPDVAGDMLYI